MKMTRCRVTNSIASHSLRLLPTEYAAIVVPKQLQHQFPPISNRFTILQLTNHISELEKERKSIDVSQIIVCKVINLPMNRKKYFLLGGKNM